MKNIFLAPRANETAYEHFESTIIGGRKYSLIEPFLNDEDKKILSKYDTISIWGTKESLRSRWEQMKPGDYVLFYANRLFYYSARVVMTKIDPNLALKLWPNSENGQPWSCLFFVDNVKPIQIPIKTVQELAEYSDAWDRVQGFMRLNDDGTRAIINKFGSIETFIDQSEGTLEIITHIIEEQKSEQIEGVQEESFDLSQALREASDYRDTGPGYEMVEGKQKRRIESKKQKERVAAIEEYRCQLCGWRIEWTDEKSGKKRYRIDIDHIIEKSQGGGEELCNLWALCPNCHAKKTVGYIKVDIEKKKVYEGGKEVSVKFDKHLFV